MSRVAQLAVAAAVYAIDRPYSYRVPEDMPLAAGMRVLGAVRARQPADGGASFYPCRRATLPD